MLYSEVLQCESQIQEKPYVSKMDNIQMQAKSLQIDINLKKIQLSVPSALKIKLMWIRGSKKLETKKKVVVEPKTSTTSFSETMSLVTKFHPDPNNPGQFKRKRCYLQIMAITKRQMKPVGILPFNLTEFVGISPQSTMKLTFAKCFDPKAAVFLTTSQHEIESSSNLETESNVTTETISDTFSECSNSMVYEPSMSNQVNASTTDGTNLSSYVESDTKSASFISNCGNRSACKSARGQASMSMNKDKLLIQKLSNELSHYKTLLREMATKKEEAEQKQISQAEELEKQKGLIEEKNKHLSSIKLELKAQQEELETKELENHSERHKLKMKIDYLTNKCFQLNCKLDKKDYSEVPKPPEKDSAILLDIIENKKKEYSTGGQIQDPADFLFNIFAQYESLNKNVKMLSEENDLLKNQLAEAKVKYADSAGQKEKLGIEMKSIQNQIQRLSTHSSQRGSQTSTGSQNEDSQESIRGERKVGTISSYLGGISFWRKNQ